MFMLKLSSHHANSIINGPPVAPRDAAMDMLHSWWGVCICQIKRRAGLLGRKGDMEGG